jgi:transcriptional regulator
MSTRDEGRRTALLQGTLDLLVLRTLEHGREHGHGITLAIEQSSNGVLLVDHGSLYPALQRLEDRGLISATWGVSVNGRRARFYSLTVRGRKALSVEATRWRTLADAVAQVLGPGFAGI